MAIYAATIPGYAATIPGRNKRVLVRADNKTDAMGRFVSVESLTSDDMQEALDSGESVWKIGDPMPDDAPEADADAEDSPPAAKEDATE